MSCVMASGPVAAFLPPVPANVGTGRLGRSGHREAVLHRAARMPPKYLSAIRPLSDVYLGTVAHLLPFQRAQLMPVRREVPRQSFFFHGGSVTASSPSRYIISIY